jgi:hypothetical protein
MYDYVRHLCLVVAKLQIPSFNVKCTGTNYYQVVPTM